MRVYPTIAERLEKWTVRPSADACWEWTGSKYPNGYGRFSISTKRFFAHRIAWEHAHGKITDGAYVCHKCDNRACVNPQHLYLGTHESNMRDRRERNRWRSGSKTPKLTQADADRVKSMRAAGISYKEIRVRTGFSHGSIHNLLSGRSPR